MNNHPIVMSCSALTKTFQEGELAVSVLQGVDLQIAARERIAIIGSSGSGKSTLLHCLGTLEQPTSGSLHIAGKDVAKLSEKERGSLRNQALGFVYQFHHLLPEFTALENVAMPLFMRGMHAQQAYAESERILARVGLQQRLKHKPSELSGGERQRTAIARALVTNPQCVLADEPTGNLDSKTAAAIYELMQELNETTGTSFVIVTHDERLAQQMTTVYRMQDGKLSVNA